MRVFANASLARRMERAEVGLILEGARAACRRVPPKQPVIEELNGGAVVYLEAGAPSVGFGFGGVPDVSALTRLERQFDDRRAPLQFEVSTLAVQRW